MKKPLLILTTLLLLLAQTGMAQPADKPTVAFLAYSHVPSSMTIQVAMLDVLQSYGFINPQDRPPMRGLMTLEEAEHSPINFFRMSVNHQFELVRGMIATALDREADILVTLSPAVTFAALQATYDMPDPPAIFFADVYNLVDSGIADADCIKPDHITGLESVTHYDEIVALLLMQNPAIKTIGTIHDSSDAAGIYGAGQIAEAGESLGLTVVQAAINSLADVALAMSGLISKGVEAVLLPVDDKAANGMPIVVNIANDEGLPVYYTAIDGMPYVAVAAGYYQFYEQGERLGALLAAYLNGELNIATTGISRLPVDSMGVILNPAAAAMVGLEFSADLQERADALYSERGGFPMFDQLSERGAEGLMAIFENRPEALEARAERDREFLASLECTAERIAEQQAELDALRG